MYGGCTLLCISILSCMFLSSVASLMYVYEGARTETEGAGAVAYLAVGVWFAKNMGNLF